MRTQNKSLKHILLLGHSKTVLMFFLLFMVLRSDVNLAADLLLFDKDSQHCVSERIVVLTVFIHGIMDVRRHLSLKNAYRFINDTVCDTMYARTVSFMREDPFFYQNQPMYKLGLHRINLDDTGDDTRGVRCIAHLFEEVRKIHQPEKKNGHEYVYYAFGWNGLLSQQARLDAAHDLFDEIIREQEAYRQKGFLVRLRLIGYSHGGNVALNLVAAYEEKKTLVPNFVIDELILIGTPIKTENNCLAHNNCVKKVYNLYSLKDRVQTLDLFSHNQMFSCRTFNTHLPLLDKGKIVQVQIKVTRLANHCYKKVHYYEQSKQTQYNSVVTGHSHLLRDISPGHTELWFFGWTPRNYRIQYPLYPLPTTVVIPYIIPYLEKLSAENTHVIVDIRPEHEQLIIKKNKKPLEYSCVPFINKEKIKKLQNLSFLYKPFNQTQEGYTRRFNEAFERARHECSVDFVTTGASVSLSE